MLTVDESKASMREKLDWMKRSLDRMNASHRDPVVFQDHFWSFLHGHKLLFYYLGRFVKDTKASVNAPDATKKWLATIDPEQAFAWECFDIMRDSDVHTEPVSADLEDDALLDTTGDPLLDTEGTPLCVSDYFVDVPAQTGKKPRPAAPRQYATALCRGDLLAARRFVAEIHDFVR